ncbi:hypothetical protein EVAR_84199_1 [Eumeta japonica]|uniref:Uncharacterized protein n=1 Tax=Eumeta variegata TaxID=151549 RepID=A0A4C1S7K3_EUMVA|nr:hypothetical protein EVAR_84199_1 [Eumeta japonica]
MLTSPSYHFHPPYRSLQRDHLSLEDRAEGIEPGVEYQICGPTTADGPPSGVEVLDALVPISGTRAVKQVAEIHGSLELPVDKVSLSLFALHLIQPGRLPHPYVERKQPRRISAVQGTLYGEPALRATLRWTASSILRTPSFCRRCPSARCVQHGWLDYGNMVLTTSGPVALAARAKPL